MAGERHGHGMLCVNRPLGINRTAFAHSIIRDLKVPVISPNIYYSTHFKKLLIKQIFLPGLYYK